MSAIRLTDEVTMPTVKMKVGGTGFGTLEIDGKPIEHLSRSVSIRTQLDSVPDVRIDILALGGLDLELSANVIILAEVVESGILEVERSDDGKTQRIRFIREGP